MTTQAIGPILMSTIFSRNPEASIQAWCQYLGQNIHSEAKITIEQAENLGSHRLAGQTSIWLANKVGEPWLNIIQSPDDHQNIPFKNHGWLSLEIAVSDVDALYEKIKESPFEVIGLPANLDVSDDIRAMQAVGLDGEVLYLTEVKAPVPPFEIPMARCEVDRLFIAVGTVPNRDEAVQTYEQFDGVKTYAFDTKITVINRALGFEIDRKHPIATFQLNGSNMVELDEVADMSTPLADASNPPNGIAIISFAVKSLPSNAQAYEIPNGPFKSKKACLIRGTAGEFMELIEHTGNTPC